MIEGSQEESPVVVVEGNSATVDREAFDAQKDAAQEQETLLAGKYKTPADLEQGYLELSKKLGSQDADQEEAGAPEEETEEEAEDTSDTSEDDLDDALSPYGKVVGEAIQAAGIDVAAATKSFEETGTLTAEDFAKFADAGFPQEIVEAYLSGVTGQQQQAAEISVAQVETIKASVGGEEQFAKLRQFVAVNYSVEEKAAYNEAIESGDFTKAQAAVASANARYNQEFGSEKPMVSGAGSTGGDGYDSYDAMKADMRDPRYAKSQAFRDQVAQKISRSSLFKTA